MHSRSCAYQGVRNLSFSEKFANLLNEWSSYEKYTVVINGLQSLVWFRLKKRSWICNLILSLHGVKETNG